MFSRRSQIHLSSAVILMFVASLLLWANLRARVTHYVIGETRIDRGWPFTIVSELRQHYETRDGKNVHRQWSTPDAAADALVALLVMYSTYFVCERRAARRADGSEEREANGDAASSTPKS